MAPDVGRAIHRWISRLALVGSAGLLGLALVPVASAHDGTLHGGTPHWLLLGLLVLGLAIIATSVLVSRRLTDDLRLVLAGVFLGAVLSLVGVVGLTELQVEPLGTDPTPLPRSLYPLVALGAGALVLLSSLNLGIWRWSRRPAYPALGGVLGLWIVYPVLLPTSEYTNPVGYALVLSVPALVGFILWKDVAPALGETDPLERRVAVGAALLFVVFLLFSTGQLSLNPDEVPVAPDQSFVAFTTFANPLVLWPAVEFFDPSIPLFGAMSVGTAITFSLLAGLVGCNAALATLIRASGIEVDRTRGVLGGLATTGATACCCCAPAFYGVVSAVFGLSAGSLYWVFLDPASPLGSMFFVVAIVLMTASTVQLARSIEANGICARPA